MLTTRMIAIYRTYCEDLAARGISMDMSIDTYFDQFAQLLTSCDTRDYYQQMSDDDVDYLIGVMQPEL